MAGLLEITDLRTEIRLRDRTVRPVNGVSLVVGALVVIGFYASYVGMIKQAANGE